MPRLPQPGSDDGQWGDILNDFLAQSHKSDGSLKDNVVTGASIAPGSLTKADVGLGNVDNTSDTNKPISTAQQAALNLKADTTALSSKLDIADLDTQTATKITTNGTAVQIALASHSLSVLKPSNFGAVGDGTTDDATSLNSMYAATGDLVIMERGKTYKINSHITITKDTDLNGCTLDATRITLMSGVTLSNGMVHVTEKIYGNNVSDVTVKDVVISCTASANGVNLVNSTHVKVQGCVVTGGVRGILLEACDDFDVTGNTVSGLTTPGAYGILVFGTPGQIHGSGHIIGNIVPECYFGICVHGGEANPSQGGFTGDYILEDIEIAGNLVTISSANLGTLIGCIWATCSRRLNIHDNIVNGSLDVGVDLEHCTHCSVSGNTITDVSAGGISAVFGSDHIVFSDNTITYSGTKTGSSSVVGTSWTGTSNYVSNMIGDGSYISYEGNSFSSENGTLGKFDLGTKCSNITVADNTFHNCYLAANAASVGDVKDVSVVGNTFTFDINTGYPVIYGERMLRFRIERNVITLKSGETLADQNRKYISVYDVGGTNSDYIWIIDNTVNDLVAQGIGISSPSTTMHAWIIGNITDRITVYWNGGVASSNMTFDKNYKLASPGYVQLSAHDNAGLFPTYPTLT